MLTPEQQKAISAAARTMKGLKWHGQGRDPATGVDCVGVPIVAFRLIGLEVKEGKPDYQLVQSHKIVRVLTAHMDLQPRGAQPQAGDVVVFGIHKRESHVGLLVDADPLNMIHCPMGGRVVEARFDPKRGDIRGIYRWRSLQSA